MITASSFRKLKESAQNKIERDIKRAIEINFEEKKAISNAELAKILGARNGQ